MTQQFGSTTVDRKAMEAASNTVRFLTTHFDVDYSVGLLLADSMLPRHDNQKNVPFTAVLKMRRQAIDDARKAFGTRAGEFSEFYTLIQWLIERRKFVAKTELKVVSDDNNGSDVLSS